MCYEHDKTTGTIGSGSMITARRTQGTCKLVRSCMKSRDQGSRDGSVDHLDLLIDPEDP